MTLLIKSHIRAGHDITGFPCDAISGEAGRIFLLTGGAYSEASHSIIRHMLYRQFRSDRMFRRSTAEEMMLGKYKGNYEVISLA